MALVNLAAARVRIEMLQAALAYASRGWFVFPCYGVDDDGICLCKARSECGNPGKHPMTPAGFRNATLDPEQIRAWWDMWPAANVAIACGQSGLAVIDVDPRNGGDVTMYDLEKEHGKLPDTVRAVTGGGGSHEFFQLGEEQVVKCGVLGLGVDLKSEGGYVLAAPSKHASGRGYFWEAQGHPEDTAIQPLPGWVAKRGQLKSVSEAYAPGGGVQEGFLGAAFAAAGWLGRALGPTKSTVVCPWETEHTGGTRHDSSTVVFAPTRGYKVGWFHCSHAHCSRRSLRDVLSYLPDAAKAKARTDLGLDAQYEPPEDHATESSPVATSPDEGTWTRALTRKQDGSISRDPGNAALLLANLEEWKGALVYDAFSETIQWGRPPPAMPGLEVPSPGRTVHEPDYLYVGHWLARVRGVSFARDAIRDAFDAAARCNTVHPVRDYLRKLVWDRQPRAQAWLSRYLGVEDSAYSSAVGLWWGISAVARVMSPGCQVDHMLVLEGPQGGGKSSALRILGGAWYLGAVPRDLGHKDSALLLNGKWICEWGEMATMYTSRSEQVKEFLTKTADTYRPPYGRVSITKLRQCVFAGTTNPADYLSDPTGGRRFWPVKCRDIDRDGLETDRDQLWAELTERYSLGEQWHPGAVTADLRLVIQGEQEARYEGDPWEPVILAYCGFRGEVTMGELLGTALNIEQSKWDRASQLRVGNILRRAGFESFRKRTSDTASLVRAWRRKGD